MAEIASGLTVKQQLLSELDAAFAELMAAVNGLSEAEMDRVWLGDWSLRDILAHIGGWQRQLLTLVEQPPQAADAVNGKDVSSAAGAWADQARQLEPAALLALLQEVQYNLMTAARAAADDRFPEGTAVYRFFNSCGAHHIKEHTEQIVAWRRQEGI